MRVRVYGLLLLAAVGVAPLAIFGLVAAERAEETAIAEVRAGNARVARSIAHDIGSYFRSEQRLLVTLGEAALQVRDPEEAQALLDAYSLSHLHVHDIAVYRRDGSLLAGRVRYDDLAPGALAGEPARTDIAPSEDGFSFQTTLAEPVVVAGRREGAVVARVDLVGLWKPVNAVKVGATGFIRLLKSDGELLAHGHPEERRKVFDPDRAIDAALLVGAFLGEIVENQQGEEIVASVAHVPALDSYVVVEQSVAEAFAPVAAMRRTLLYAGAIGLVAAAIVGLFAGGFLVRSLEKLRAHTRVLAGGDLDQRLEARIRIVEVQALAGALNEMAAGLKKHQDEATARERITAFARVAAGLAHDLQNPILAMQMATDAVLDHPDDRGARGMLQKVAAIEIPKLTRFCDDLRRLAKSGKTSLELAPVDPGALAAEVASELSASPKWSGVTFSAQGGAARSTADAGLLRRALYNLGANGADACAERWQGPKGKVAIAVRQEGNFIVFRVEDDGVGIPSARLSELARNDFTSTKRTTGVGLGLVTARHVAESHGGRLEIESEPGQGSAFSLILPRREPGQQLDGPGGRDSEGEAGEIDEEDAKARAS